MCPLFSEACEGRDEAAGETGRSWSSQHGRSLIPSVPNELCEVGPAAQRVGRRLRSQSEAAAAAVGTPPLAGFLPPQS